MGKYIYVDNSNVWIEGKYHSAVKKGMVPDVYTAHDNKICDMPWSYDFGKLLTLSCGGDVSDLKRAVLYGSKPTNNDSLWNSARSVGFDVFHPTRNIREWIQDLINAFYTIYIRELLRMMMKLF